MSRYETRTWTGDPVAQTRKGRQPLTYEAFVPDPIAEAELPLPGSAAALVSDADRAVSELNGSEPAATSLEALARQLLRSEALASSRIEGLELSQKRLVRAGFDPEGTRDDTARSVLGNTTAMERAIALGESAKPITAEDIVELHATLFKATRDSHIAGWVRDRQNWIGGSAVSPAGAEFIPPPPEYVPDLMEDLAAFLNREDLPATLQAAVAHAQFETIHPFTDGNGRVGRCLIHVVMRRQGLATRYVPPISLVLATNVRQYVAGLTDYRKGDLGSWCSLFGDVTVTAVRAAEQLSQTISDLQESWREQAGRPRRDSAASRIIEGLPANPLIDGKAAQEITGASVEAARVALQRLADSGVIQQVTVGRRNRVWEAAKLYEVVDKFELELATPPGQAKPARPAPHGHER